jgi:hypothetical protein
MFIPDIAKDVVTIAFFSFFAVKFFSKSRTFKTELAAQRETLITESVVSEQNVETISQTVMFTSKQKQLLEKI